MDFKQEYLGEWPEQKHYDIAIKLWAQYFFLTEEYDRELTRGRIHPEFNCAMPQFQECGEYYHTLSTQYARTVRKITINKARCLNISSNIMLAAKKEASRYSHEMCKKITEMI